MAAAYMYHIIKNHAFLDGNKRTGATASLIFLTANKRLMTFTQEELVACAIDVATSKLSIEELADLLKNNSIDAP